MSDGEVSTGRVTLANVVLTDLGGGLYRLTRNTSVTEPSATTTANYSAIDFYPHVQVLVRWYSEGRPMGSHVRTSPGSAHRVTKANGTYVDFTPATLDAARAWSLPNGGEWA